MTETQVISKWRKEHPNHVVLKIHGGRFQSSLPDIIDIDPTGKVKFLEVKSVTGKTLPWSKMDLAQLLMLRKLGKQGAFARYLVWSDKLGYVVLDPELVVEGTSTDLEVMG